jgi:hypothetical protein
VKRRIFFIVGIIVLTVSVYSGGLRAGYHADDWSHQYIPREFSSPFDLIAPPAPFDTSFRPVFLAHLLILSKISEHSIPLARLWTVLIHAFSAILVFEIARFILPSRSITLALVAALWFSVAFCHFEVPNAFTNSETPGVFFLLLTLFLLIRRWPDFSKLECVCVSASWTLSLLSKEYALWIPVGLFLCQVFPPLSGRMRRSVFIGLLAFMVSASVLFLFRFATIDREAGDMALLLQPTVSLGGLRNLFSGIVSLPFFDPTHPRWSGILQGRLGIPSSFLLACHLLFLGFFIGLCARLWRQGEGRLPALAIALVVCPLVLTCWLPGPPASRHVYLPSAGFGLVIAGNLHCFGKEAKKSLWKWAVLFCVIFAQAAGNWCVGMELERTTRLRERLTARLAEEISSTSPEKTVILDGIPPQARVEMSLPFLFPDWRFESTTPSPLLKVQPLERFRANPPGDDEAVVLVFEGSGNITRASVSELLALREGLETPR